MKLAFTISSYRLCDFVLLGLKQIRTLSPESPVLISDDQAPESGAMKEIASSNGAAYACSRLRRGHFAADYQGLVNALALAESVGADVAVKISQRFILRRPEAINAIVKAFENPDICVATPGQPNTGNAKRGFGAFTTLSDIVMIRVGCMTPQDLILMYRSRLLREKAPWSSFIEIAVDDLHNRFAGRTVKIPELTNPTADPIFLRRYQSGEQQYRDLAASHGLNGNYPLTEWNAIEGKNYLCRPLVV